ncbi:hypothetical protein G647_00518 [Cladophialophora carrionii CBS 160.54]|uniref:PNPLA domain-containing protein n=1 Tax=Cladophialophora carrionii CBS 160.54 TaxID=1279043 RepID=V9DMD6_9EURO|nr:uncharacterized protein G647_00518 [Cladophialophora carrionii CBS 160.54]ETI28069.1 hypothetical protein G647_00518 [Cladophialophora carrionii CBS 160.54]
MRGEEDDGVPAGPRSVATGLRSCLASLGALVAEQNDEPLMLRGVLGFLQDELGRLRLWAADTGAFQPRAASLDARLRKSPHLKEQVLRTLSMLAATVDDIKDMLTDSEISNSSNNQEAEYKMVCETIASLIGDLYQMSTVFGRPASVESTRPVRMLPAVLPASGTTTIGLEAPALSEHEQAPPEASRLSMMSPTSIEHSSHLQSLAEPMGSSLEARMKGHSIRDTAAELRGLDRAVSDPPELFQTQSNDAMMQYMPEANLWPKLNSSGDRSGTANQGNPRPRGADIPPDSPVQTRTPGSPVSKTDYLMITEAGGGDEPYDQICRYCGIPKPAREELYYCPACGIALCTECWNTAPPHRQGLQILGGVLHEKLNATVARTILGALDPGLNDREQEMLFLKDEDTTWFGVHHEQEELYLREYGRFERVIREDSSLLPKATYPALVSFVGQTGAGKSTLVRLLIELNRPRDCKPQVPVVAGANFSMPITGDVHLYADSRTLETNHPVLYIDSEGLDGGSYPPLGARSRRNQPRVSTKVQCSQDYVSERPIAWAGPGERRTRTYTTERFHQRILYSISDVVVFVATNTRNMEQILKQLVSSGHDSLEHSVNQPVQPQAIIVLNGRDAAALADHFDTAVGTTDFLSDEGLRDLFRESSELWKAREFWRRRGRKVDTTRGLLLCYFSDVHVIPIPGKERLCLLGRQLDRLHRQIQSCCDQSRESKRMADILLNVDEMQQVHQQMFDHFTTFCNGPFDYLKACLSTLTLAANIVQVSKGTRSFHQVLQKLAFMVASCSMLEVARQHSVDVAEDVYPRYAAFCSLALAEIYNNHGPATVYILLRELAYSRQARISRAWTASSVMNYLETPSTANSLTILQRFRDGTFGARAYRQKAAEIHRTLVVGPFYAGLGGPEPFQSNSSCLSCLANCPVHPLPCGHVLCTPCVLAFGTSTQYPYIIEVKDCPLHGGKLAGRPQSPVQVHLEPKEACPRVLSLDGGGVRGLVDLMILEQLEKELGEGLPIQAFFDLTVVTNAGGVIALCLGVKGWDVQSCTVQLERFCRAAFSKTRWTGRSGNELLVTMSNQSRYQTEPLEEDLRAAFGNGLPFESSPGKQAGHDTGDLPRPPKVAVTASTTSGSTAVFANYNRLDPEEVDKRTYRFVRSEKPSTDLLIFQAARATTATPFYFWTFKHHASRTVYMDGSPHYHCPVEIAVRESRLLWQKDPDVLVSLGAQTTTGPGAPSPLPTGPGRSRGIMDSGKLAMDLCGSTVDSEADGHNILPSVESRDPPWQDWRTRLSRLDVALGPELPTPDDISQIDRMKNEASLRITRMRDKIKSVADRLLASSFYFAVDDQISTPRPDGSWTIPGRIMCRMAPGSAVLRSLGRNLKSRWRSSGSPGPGSELGHGSE